MEKTIENPFLRQDQFPDFPAMTPAAAREALPLLLASAESEVDRLEREATPGWSTFVEPLSDATRPLVDAWGLVGHLSSVCNSDEWRSLEAEYIPKLVAFNLRCSQSKRFLDLYAATCAAEADPVRRRIEEKAWRGMQLSGVGLEGEAKARFNAICESLAKLSKDFGECVLDATKAWKLEVAESDLDGLPESAKEMLKEDGKYFLRIDDASYVPEMKHLKDRALREKVYRARVCRAPENKARIDEILALRRERANMLGFSSHAELSLETKCAPSVGAVMAMIDDLAEASLKVSPKEDAELEAECPYGKPEPWDIAFFAERLRERTYSYSEAELSEYFNLPDVLRGLFALAERLFGVTVEERAWTVGTWHDDVRFFAVKNASGEDMAYFYLDPYVRPGLKQGGAWMNEFRTLRPGVKPVAVVCCNFPKPAPDGRCLLRFREVETVFHEFGHALQHMLTTVSEPEAAGVNLIEWDAVEVASQFMENWCVDASTMRTLALHCERREPMPEELFAKVRAAKNFRAANACLRQLAFTKIDMYIHGVEPCDPDEVKRRVFDEYRQPLIDGDQFLESFGHIFVGAYSAGYYSYKWSEVMSADCFGAFEEAGLDDEEAVRATGRRFRDTFLALGGSMDPMEVFRLFRGRAPSTEALLRQQGLGPGAVR